MLEAIPIKCHTFLVFLDPSPYVTFGLPPPSPSIVWHGFFSFKIK